MADIRGHGDREDRRVQELILTVAQSASDAIVATNATGEIVYANPALESMFGHEPGGLLGRPSTVLLAEADAAGVVQRLAEVAATADLGTLAVVELTGRRADGSEFPIEASRGVHTGPDGLLDNRGHPRRLGAPPHRAAAARIA